MTGRPARPTAPAPVRVRRGRIAALSLSVLVTLTAALGGLGVLPDGGTPSYASAPPEEDGGASAALASAAQDPPEPEDVSVPADSGEGRRIVFDISDQRVWLVRGDESVARTYLVSGSIYDNLDPGSYQVYSKSRDAIGIDDSGTMHFMVRFASGANAAIGFHDIPVHEGEPVQTRAELGTPTSHGCIRQARPDAKALWAFAPVGTDVVVTA